MTGSTLMNETEFFQWVRRIQALRPPPDQTTGGSSADEEAGLDLVAAFRVFDRDKNGFITKVYISITINNLGNPFNDTLFHRTN
jgi:hypothetical protein